MLSEREKQVLDDIERHLAESDPKLAHRLMRATRLPRWWGWAVVVAGWLVMVAAGLAGWWLVTVLLLGPLTAITLAWMLHDTP